MPPLSQRATGLDARVRAGCGEPASPQSKPQLHRVRFDCLSKCGREILLMPHKKMALK